MLQLTAKFMGRIFRATAEPYRKCVLLKDADLDTDVKSKGR
jgi:hypothetical protein